MPNNIISYSGNVTLEESHPLNKHSVSRPTGGDSWVSQCWALGSKETPSRLLSYTKMTWRWVQSHSVIHLFNKYLSRPTTSQVLDWILGVQRWIRHSSCSSKSSEWSEGEVGTKQCRTTGKKLITWKRRKGFLHRWSWAGVQRMGKFAS